MIRSFIATLFLATFVGGMFSTAALATEDPDYYDSARINGSELIDRGTDQPDYYDRGTEQPDYYDRNSDTGNDR